MIKQFVSKGKLKFFKKKIYLVLRSKILFVENLNSRALKFFDFNL